jgi:oligosaccharide translocation protein RFT1
MSAFSVAFAASAYLFMRVFPLGAIGLVFANIVNMLCRIVWSASFIKVFFKRHGADFSLAELLPGGTLAVAAASIGVMYQLDITEHSKEEPIKTLVKIVVSAIPLLIHMYVITSTPRLC